MSKPKIVSLMPRPVDHLKKGLALKTDLSTVEVVAISPPKATEDEICEAVDGATVIIGNYSAHNYITRRVMEVARGVRCIQFGSVLYAGVDLEAAKELGVPVANNPGWNATSVAEHALMFMLVLLKKALYAHQATSQGRWVHLEIWSRVKELRGKTLGILGLGTTGTEVARCARVFGPRIIYHKRTRLSEAEEAELGVEYCDFDELLALSGILSIHVPLTDETRGMIGREEIARMKTGAILLNLARGEVVDDAALAEAIREGRLSGAGVDVFDGEVIDPESPLIGLENVILTPHIAGFTADSRARATAQLVDNIVRVLGGEKPLYVVNGL